MERAYRRVDVDGDGDDGGKSDRIMYVKKIKMPTVWHFYITGEFKCENYTDVVVLSLSLSLGVLFFLKECHFRKQK